MGDKAALIIGNSDGIGLALTKRLLSLGWQVVGLSKSSSPLEDNGYRHIVADVTDDTYCSELASAARITPDITVYCAGIGQAFDITTIELEQRAFEVNLIGAVRTIETILPRLVANKCGHIIVLSSLADVLITSESPSYAASKAALSSYVEGIALAVRQQGVAITNVRFGFVDTKMAKGVKQLFMMPVDKAVDHLLKCIRKQPIRYSRPRIVAAIVLVIRWFTRARMMFSG